MDRELGTIVHSSNHSPVRQRCDYLVSHASRNGALSRRTGSMTTVHTNASTPCTAIPTMRNGNSKSHTNGYAISATIASGQQSTNKMHQSRNAIMTLLLV